MKVIEREHLCKATFTVFSCLLLDSSDQVRLYFIFKCLFIHLAIPGSKLWHSGFLVAACGISFPDRGLNPGFLHWEWRVLASGPPGKSPGFILMQCFVITWHVVMDLWRDACENSNEQVIWGAREWEIYTVHLMKLGKGEVSEKEDVV